MLQLFGDVSFAGRMFRADGLRAFRSISDGDFLFLFLGRELCCWVCGLGFVGVARG